MSAICFSSSVSFMSGDFSFPSPGHSVARRGKEKRAFDASRLWHRQAPWEESKPKARNRAWLRRSLPCYELGCFQTEVKLSAVCPRRTIRPATQQFYQIPIPRATAASGPRKPRTGRAPSGAAPPSSLYSQFGCEILRNCGKVFCADAARVHIPLKGLMALTVP